MDKEIWTDILFGLVALTIPLAFYIAYLDIRDWADGRQRLMFARALTRLGWGITVSAIAIRAVLHYPVIEHGPPWVYAMFIVGLVVSCLGFLGVARNYNRERATWTRQAKANGYTVPPGEDPDE